MDKENLPDRLDERRFAELAKEAARAGDCSNQELGEMVRVMVKKLMLSDEFRLFTEDWVPEMVSAAYVSVFNAIPRLDLARYPSPYNYLYTTARHAIRKETDRLKRRHAREVPELGIGDFEPSEKRWALSKVPPVSAEEEKKLVVAATERKSGMRAPRLAAVIDGVFGRFERRLERLGGDVDLLADMVRERRKSWKTTKI